MTAELNTLKNIVEKEVAIEMLKDKYSYDLELMYFNAQGDDQMVRTKDYIDAVIYYTALSSTGPNVNLLKNFFSEDHDEYLRITGQKNIINGYLPRVIDSMMWEPTTEKQTEMQKIAETFSIWRRISMRMYQPFKSIKNYFTRDLVANKVIYKNIVNFLNTPRTLGGSGLIKNDGLYDVIRYKESEILENINFNGAGLKQFEDVFLQNQKTGIKNWLVNTVQFDKSGMRESESISYQQHESLTSHKFLIAKNRTIKKPKFKEGWDQSCFITINDKVMEEAFPDIDDLLSKYHTGKKFIYNWLAGTIKVARPLIENKSDNLIALISEQYENSIIYAMLKKKIRRNDPWMSLNLYYEQNLEKFVEYYFEPSTFIGM